MGKKRRNYPNLEELLTRPWCYYCERDFEDLKLLISHQKAKHFKCERCGRRLNTAGGLAVHMNQVHKENLQQVDNALEGREGLEVEIFGMEGVPDDTLAHHHQQILQAFHQGRADRQAATGNPPPGQPGSHRPIKKIRIETADELKQRLAAFRAQAGARQAQAAAAAAAAAAHKAQAAASADPTAAAAAAAGTPTSATPLSALPTHGAAGLPQRPGYHNNGAPPGFPGFPGAGASTLDDLVSGGAAAAAQPPSAASGDDIDKIIRMAEAGIKTAPPSAASAAHEDRKEKKKDKAMRMVYADGNFSLEERMAQLGRYAVAV